MSDPSEPLVQTCATCGALIDVSEEEPFALMHCPNCGTGMRVRRSFDHFELQEILGAGGMGAVYKALDQNLNRMVALKLLRKEFSADEEFVQRFQHEAAITASMNHQNVVKVYSSGEDHGLIYIAMELVDKGSLDDLMTLQGRVSEAQVLEVGAQIARGLNAALERGLIHRDIKPGNILFSDAHTAKIVDFGLAVLMEEAGKVAGEVWGTPYYVAPEKLDNQPEDFRSDIYSLGATLFHAVAGRPPFEAETASLVALKHVKSQAVSLQAFAPDVSSATAYVINKTLSKDPDERYQSYQELIDHLEYARSELLAKAAGPAKQKTRVVLEGEEEQKAMSWITFGMIAVVVLAGVLIFTFRGGKKSDDAGPVITQEERNAAADFEKQYQAARELLLGGKYAEAIEKFRALESSKAAQLTQRNWATVHEGLALLLAGREPEARTAFAKIPPRGGSAAEPTLSEFLAKLAEKMSGDKAPDPAEAKYELGTYQAIAHLLLGLKAWEMEKFEDANRFFRVFPSAAPRKSDSADSPSPYGWISDYKDIAARYAEDLTVFRGVSEQIKSADTIDKQKKAIEAAKAARGKLKLKSKLADTLEAGAAELEKKIAAVEAEKTRKAVEEEAADAKILGEAKQKVATLVPQFKFNEARQAIASARPRGEKAKREHTALVRRMEWLARFKSLLIGDLTAAGYPNPIRKKAGGDVAGGVSGATDAQIAVRTPFGFVPVPWPELAPESAYAMAGSFVRGNLTPDQIADRKWLLGVFALSFGKPAEARTLLADAAQAKREYSDAMPLLLEFAESK